MQAGPTLPLTAPYKCTHFCTIALAFATQPHPQPHAPLLVLLQFPDPHFKRKHRKRRVVQPQLVAALAQLMAPGGRVLLQSDVEEVAVAMRDMFEQYGCQAFALSPQHAPGAVFFSETRQQQQEEEEAGGLAALGADGAEPRAERQEGGGSAEEGPPLGGASGYSSDEESGVEGGGGGLRPEHPADHPGGARSAEQQAGSDGGGAAESMPGEPAMSRTRQELNWWRGGWLAENPLVSAPPCCAALLAAPAAAACSDQAAASPVPCAGCRACRLSASCM